MGGEAHFPRWSLSRSANMVPTRLGFIYILSIIFIGLLVPSDDHRLLSGSGITASPFVVAVVDAGIPGLPSVINICMIIGVLAIALECIYLPSRILRTMALQGFIPQYIANVDAKGRPRWALAITAVVALLCTYIGLSSEFFPSIQTYNSKIQVADQIYVSRHRLHRPQLARLHHQRLLLHKLGCYRTNLLPLPLCPPRPTPETLRRTLTLGPHLYGPWPPLSR